MRRLRALLSPDPLDQEISQRVDRARREIFAAMEKCNPRSEQDILKRRRMQVTRRGLEGILVAMDSVKCVGTTPEEVTPTAPKPRPVKEVRTPTPSDTSVE